MTSDSWVTQFFARNLRLAPLRQTFWPVAANGGAGVMCPAFRDLDQIVARKLTTGLSLTNEPVWVTGGRERPRQRTIGSQ